MKTTQYNQLNNELDAFKGMMSQAADSILDQEISKYPIFIVHQYQIEVGIPLFEIDKNTKGWKINASSLEEFVSKQLIDSVKIDSFRTIYKDPHKFLCLFVLSELGANFIFVPRSSNKKVKQ